MQVISGVPHHPARSNRCVAVNTEVYRFVSQILGWACVDGAECDGYGTGLHVDCEHGPGLGLTCLIVYVVGPPCPLRPGRRQQATVDLTGMCEVKSVAPLCFMLSHDGM